MSAKPNTLVGTLIAAAEREEQMIERLMIAVEKNDKTAVTEAARAIAKNRNRLPEKKQEPTI